MRNAGGLVGGGSCVDPGSVVVRGSGSSHEDSFVNILVVNPVMYVAATYSRYVGKGGQCIWRCLMLRYSGTSHPREEVSIMESLLVPSTVVTG